jgi:hypothetical protein
MSTALPRSLRWCQEHGEIDGASLDVDLLSPENADEQPSQVRCLSRREDYDEGHHARDQRILDRGSTPLVLDDMSHGNPTSRSAGSSFRCR